MAIDHDQHPERLVDDDSAIDDNHESLARPPSGGAGRRERLRVKRKPQTSLSSGGVGRPSDALIENLYVYRVLRGMSQDELALRMSRLGHGLSRSTVSAIEGRDRKVTVDELFGFATSMGVTIGDLLDPTGPDHRRQLSLDVGLTGAPPMTPREGHLWAKSQAVVRFVEGENPTIEVEASSDGVR